MMGDSGGFGFLSGIKSVGAVESFTIAKKTLKSLSPKQPKSSTSLPAG